MKIRTLGDAQQDLVSGFRFYEVQENGLGSYFLDSLYALGAKLDEGLFRVMQSGEGRDALNGLALDDVERAVR
jgi:hypothetical protein